MSSATEKGRIKEPKRLFARNVVRKVLLEDWLLKLIALAITIGLWLGVTGLSTPATKRLSVQLLPSVANNLEITNSLVSEVDIVVSGDDRRLKSLTGRDIIAVLDLTSVPPGDRVVSLSPENVSVELPQGVKLDDVQPNRIAVRIESVEEVELPVNANLVGKPADGFEIYGQTVLPQKVRVRGPTSFLSTLQAMSTDPISVEGKKEDLSAKQVPIAVPNTKSIIFNTVVDVIVRIGERRTEQIFTLPASPQTNEKKAAITLFGPKTVLSKIRPADLRIEFVKNDAGGDIPQAVVPQELLDTVEVKKVRLF